MSQLTTNTTTIDECLVLANSLPDAGSGGSVGTCTVMLEASALIYRPYSCCYTYMNDSGDITSEEVSNSPNSISLTIENVVCGSIICVNWARNTMVSMGSAITTTNAELMMYNQLLTAIHITAPAGGYASVMYNPIDDGPT